MVKTYAPMFSLDASGTVGNAITFSKWKGRNYARKRVIPANPKSALQVSVRAMMRFLAQAWASLGTTPKGSWEDRGEQSQVSNFNAFVGHNLSRWDRFDAPGQEDPVGETGTLPTATLDSAAGGDGHVDLEFTITSLDDVWGVAIFRGDATGFTPSKANCMAVVPVTATGSLIYTDSPLDAGTYYYDARFFTTDGVLGPVEGEVNGTAT